ncbi:hypothetical protein BT96DRAFT_1021895 [Gymnopus androsaceus JB14]|uniref:F-box domain-containing protein n=1 Tax=Gymnopus androsaceus JB14 TaxID=1447944 RepID=A0A6A4HBA1_9AGAR|nr:hypothetical protein BT96DRAFT_1021895 [Gymnopus androsaceus JB14]
MASLDETFYIRSIAQYLWPNKPLSTCLDLCAKCGDSFQFDLQELKYEETIRRVRSGYSPDGSERAVYSKQLDDAQRDMDRCQSELHRLQSLSRELVAQQDLLRVYMAGIRSIISPIHKLPLELLGEIFEYICCGDIGINCIISKAEKRLPTLAVSGVCVRWYNVVTSMPMLWSSFGSKAMDNPSTPSLFKVFLERSRLHPIDFKIDVYDCESPDDDCFSSLIAIVIENSHRWRHVEIAAQEVYMVEYALEPLINVKQHLPALVSLNLRSEFDDTLSSFPIDCPVLQSLTLDGVPLDLKYPRPKVTYLNLRNLYPDEISRVILHCPNVHVLELEPASLERWVEGVPTAPNINCNALEFKMDYGRVDHHNGTPCFFDCMTFPELSHLVLSDPGSEGEVFHTASLCSMLERGSSRLTHLSIHFIPLTSIELHRLFLCVPLVTTLEVEEPPKPHTSRPDVSMVLKSLVAPSSSDDEGVHGGEAEVGVDKDEEARCLLPRLEDLRLVTQSCTMMLLELVRSRWRPSLLTADNSSGLEDTMANDACVCLQKISIRCLGEDEEERLEVLQERLKEFKEEGLSVEVLS